MTALDDLDAALIGLRRLWSHSGTFSDPELGRVDLSTVLICRALAARPGEVTVADLATGLDVAHSTASRLVDRAERTGAVTRVASAVDARRTSVRLTPAGQRLHDVATGFRTRYLQDLLGDWQPADVDRFARLLTRFADAVGTHHPGGTP